MRIWEDPPDIEQIRRIDAADRQFALTVGIVFILCCLAFALGAVIV